MRTLGLAACSVALFLTFGCSSSETDRGSSSSGGSSSTTSTGSGGSGGSDGGHAVAPDPTGFKFAGTMMVAHALATATRLADGRVLVVGGEDNDYAMLADVEIYDPTTSKFTEAAPLPEARDHHTATLLASGEVLVVGGGEGSEISLPDGNKTLGSAVLYDPAKNVWKATGKLNQARAGHRAALLADGRVLVVGGGDGVGYSCASIHPNCTIATEIGSAEIYDPKTGAFTVTGSLSQARLASA